MISYEDMIPFRRYVIAVPPEGGVLMEGETIRKGVYSDAVFVKRNREWIALAADDMTGTQCVILRDHADEPPPAEKVPHDKMVLGWKYIVVKKSKRGEFRNGDIIKKEKDGSVSNYDAKGWIDVEDLGKAADGMLCIPYVHHTPGRRHA